MYVKMFKNLLTLVDLLFISKNEKLKSVYN